MWKVDSPLPPGTTRAQWLDAWRRERQGATNALFALRWALGRLLGLDRGSRGFTAVYTEPEEQPHRIDNRTVSALLHLSLADRRPRLAVYVRARGRVGRWYMRGIDPVRRHIVYPGLLAAGRWAARQLAL